MNQRRGSTIDDWLDDPWDTPGELYTFESEPIRKRRRWPKFVGFGLLAIAVTIILIAGAVGFWLVRQLNPPGDPGRPVNFTVNAGETLDSLATRLESQGFITSASVFTWYAERQGELVLTPGYYQLKPKDSMGNILDVLETPPEQTYTKVPVPGGPHPHPDRLAAPEDRAAPAAARSCCRRRPRASSARSSSPRA